MNAGEGLSVVGDSVPDVSGGERAASARDRGAGPVRSRGPRVIDEFDICTQHTFALQLYYPHQHPALFCNNTLLCAHSI